MPRFTYRFEDLSNHASDVLKLALQKSGLAKWLNLREADFERPFDYARAHLRHTNHVSVHYLAESFDHYDADDLRQVLEHKPLQELLRTFGYDVLYRTWLDAQIKRDIAWKQYELSRGTAPGEADKKEVRDRIVKLLSNDLDAILKRQRQLLYDFA